MKILKDAGTFEILYKTDNAIEMIAKAARTCYKSEDKATPENDIRLVKNLLNRGHEAMIEFADMIVKFTNVSRGFTHELVRHRVASYAQESTRYVDEYDFEVVVPPHRDEKEPLDYHGQGEPWGLISVFEDAEKAYGLLRDRRWKPEDARQVLPTGIKSDIVIKANMREWRHIFKMRCDKFAHWEIRAVMLKLLDWCKENIPVIFDDFHFFQLKNENGEHRVFGLNDYARPIVSETVFRDIIRHYAIANNRTENELLTLLKG